MREQLALARNPQLRRNRHRHSRLPSEEQLERENERLRRENEELRRKVAEWEKQIGERENAERQIADLERQLALRERNSQILVLPAGLPAMATAPMFSSA